MNDSTAIAARAETSLINILPPDIDEQVRALITKTKLDVTQAEIVLEKFRDGLMPFLELRAEAESTVVTDASETDKIARAKDIDMVLATAEKQIEAAHKEQKEYWLRGSQMVDGCRKIPADAIKDVRSHLKKQFDFVHLQEIARLNAIEQSRLERLAGYKYDSTGFSLRTMTDAQFAIFLSGVIAEDAKRIESERNAADEAARLRAENERLAQERAAADAREAEQRRIAQEAQRKLDEAEAEKRRFEAEAAAERDRLAKAEAAKLLAPDKDKLLSFADEIATYSVPTVTSPEAINILATFSGNLTRAIDELRRSAKALAGDPDCPF